MLYTICANTACLLFWSSFCFFFAPPASFWLLGVHFCTWTDRSGKPILRTYFVYTAVRVHRKTHGCVGSSKRWLIGFWCCGQMALFLVGTCPWLLLQMSWRLAEVDRACRNGGGRAKLFTSAISFSRNLPAWFAFDGVFLLQPGRRR